MAAVKEVNRILGYVTRGTHKSEEVTWLLYMARLRPHLHKLLTALVTFTKWKDDQGLRWVSLRARERGLSSVPPRFPSICLTQLPSGARRLSHLTGGTVLIVQPNWDPQGSLTMHLCLHLVSSSLQFLRFPQYPRK